MKTGTTPPDTRPSRTARAGVIIAAITIEAGTRSVPMIVGGYTALILAALGAGMTLKATQAGLQPELHAKIEWVYEGLTEAIYWFGYAALAILTGAAAQSIMIVRRWGASRPLQFALAGYIDTVMGRTAGPGTNADASHTKEG